MSFILPKPRFIATLLSVWLVASCIATALLFLLVTAPDRHLAERLKAHGVEVTGTILRASPEGHNAIDYFYTTPDGRTFRETGPANNPTHPQTPSSGPVAILYDSADPAVSCNCVPSKMLRSSGLLPNLAFGMAFGLLAPFAALGFIKTPHRRSTVAASRQVAPLRDPAHWPDSP